MAIPNVLKLKSIRSELVSGGQRALVVRQMGLSSPEAASIVRGAGQTAEDPQEGIMLPVAVLLRVKCSQRRVGTKSSLE